MTESEQGFVDRAVKRKMLFLRLSMVGVLVGLGLAIYYAYGWSQTGTDGDGSVATSVVLVVLILLNARQNLRQYRYAQVLEKLTANAG